MLNTRSYLTETDISQVQSQSYRRLKSSTGSTYGSRYKQRYGAKQLATPANVANVPAPVASAPPTLSA